MATFPAYAKILLAGYSEQADYGVLRTEMDGGIAKQRPRWSKGIVTIDVNIKVSSRADKLLFDEWVKTDINGGAGWFDIRLDGVVKQARIVGGKVKWSSPGALWIGQAQLEALQ
ncbi:MAG TPA: hypothetical protein VNQ97_13745 [Burkholderiaceae bacterium]|nr:hypothetical protein [Burkholderiaceae bacterium]